MMLIWLAWWSKLQLPREQETTWLTQSATINKYSLKLFKTSQRMALGSLPRYLREKRKVRQFLTRHVSRCEISLDYKSELRLRGKFRRLINWSFFMCRWVWITVVCRVLTQMLIKNINKRKLFISYNNGGGDILFTLSRCRFKAD